jgi:glutathione peroxidase-family protein
MKAAGENNMTDVYSYQAKALDGSEVKLDQYKGNVLLIVNTASKCGFTPQFEGFRIPLQPVWSSGTRQFN